MSLRDFRKAGDPPTLVSAFLYFDVSFMVWVILGPLGNFIAQTYHLTPTQRGLLTAVPLIGGSFFRLILGWMTERFGARATGIAGLSVTLLPLFLAWRFADSFAGFQAVGLLLGVAGASFAAALPLASAWYPPEHQGLAMGIAGAGNSGTLFATLFAPRLALAYGWKNVFGMAMVPVIFVLVVFIVFAKNAPGARTVKRWSDYSALLKIPDTGWFCFIYSLTFGGFVGLASYLSIFFHDQYGLTNVQSGDFTTVVVLFGSFLRPVGGILADRIGGYRMIVALLFIVGLCLAGVSTLPPPFAALGLLAIGMGMLGMGNGSVFQLVPQRFAGRVGIMTGIVGSAGGLGGFFLPSILGAVKDRLGSFGIGFALLSGLMFTGVLAMLYLKNVWRRTWSVEALARAGLQVSPRAVTDASAA